MASLNKITVIGNVGTEPEMRFTPNGSPVTNFSVATNRKVNDEDVTTWFRVNAWNKTAEACNQYLKKGQQVYVEGRLEIRKWQDKEDMERTSVEIVAHTVLFLGKKQQSAEDEEQAKPVVEPEDIPF